MYAVIETGGKQYTVELGTELEVELLDVEPGQEIKLERVLMVADGENTAIGQPIVADAEVSARVLRQDRGVKTISFKYRPKARRRVKKGHRQELTILKITEVRLGAKSAAAEAKVVEAKADAEREKIAKAAARQAAEDAVLAAQLKAREKAAQAAAPKKNAPAKTAKPAAAKPAAAKPAAAKPAAEKPAKAEKATADKPAKAAAPKAKAEKTVKPAADAPAKRPAPTKKDE
jgi:large subunit ribosomal protein L21